MSHSQNLKKTQILNSCETRLGKNVMVSKIHGNSIERDWNDIPLKSSLTHTEMTDKGIDVFGEKPSFSKPINHVQFVISTCSVETDNIKHFKKIYRIIQKDMKENNINGDLLIALNSDADKQQLEKFKHELKNFVLEKNNIKSNLSMSVIHTNIKGKINAMNMAFQIACEGRRDIMVFMDDDVFFTKNTMSKLIKTLSQKNENMLIGATPEVLKPKNYDKLTSPEKLFFLISSLRDRVAGYSTPIGGLMAMPTRMYPVIPTSVLADDLYLNAYCVKHGIEQKLHPETKVKFYGSSSYYNWVKRSMRIVNSKDIIINLLSDDLKKAFRKCVFNNPLPEKYREDVGILYETSFLGKRAMMVLGNSVDKWGADESTKPYFKQTKSEKEKFFNNVLFPYFYKNLKKYPLYKQLSLAEPNIMQKNDFKYKNIKMEI